MTQSALWGRGQNAADREAWGGEVPAKEKYSEIIAGPNQARALVRFATMYLASQIRSVCVQN